MSSFVPLRESELLTFVQHFDALITASPTDYGLTAAQATAFNALVTDFRTKYMTATNPPTRTTPAIAAKNNAKKALVNGPGGLRELAKIVQATPSVTDEQKLELGLPVHDTEPTPVPPPVDPPELDINKVTGRTVEIRLHNDTVLQRKKPVGVKGAAVFTWVGETPPDDINEWKFEGNTTKTVIDIEFPMTVPAGSKVWITAFWFNAKAQSGPPCEPDSTFLAGGLSKAA